METPVLVIVYVSFIVILEIIQFLALIYYVWTLCLKDPIKRCCRRLNWRNTKQLDSKEMPLIEINHVDYVNL